MYGTALYFVLEPTIRVEPLLSSDWSFPELTFVWDWPRRSGKRESNSTDFLTFQAGSALAIPWGIRAAAADEGRNPQWGNSVRQMEGSWHRYFPFSQQLHQKLFSS